MKHTFRIIVGIGIAASGFFSVVSFAHAAQIDISVASGTIFEGQATQVGVSLDTQGADVNTVQGTITFPVGLFRFVKLLDGGSAVSFRVTPPGAAAPGVITFAGIIPGGLQGGVAPLFSFVLMPIGQGADVIQVATATVLANDGLGSVIPVVPSPPVMVTIGAPASSTSAALSGPKIEYGAPAPFTPQVATDSDLFGGKYFLVFSTTDSGSGIDHYEVLELPHGAPPAPSSQWQSATSPYLLTDQSLSSDIYVRAVDHDGNFIMVELPAEHAYMRSVGWGWVAVVVVLLLVLSFFIWRVIRKKRL